MDEGSVVLRTDEFPRWITRNTKQFMLFGIFVYLGKGNRIRSEQTLVCVFAERRKNSPVDCFAGGSREASPFARTKRPCSTFWSSKDVFVL